MKRDYARWHDEKTALNGKSARVFFREREVWWCSLGANVGSEEDGKGNEFMRPVLIFKKFNNEVLWALPLSRKKRVGRFYAPVVLSDGLPRVAIISQLRLVDAKRLADYIGTIDRDNYDEIQKAATNLCNS